MKNTMKTYIWLFCIITLILFNSCKRDETCIWYQETYEMSSSFFGYNGQPYMIEDTDTIKSNELIIDIGFSLRNVTTELECHGISTDVKNEVAGTIKSFVITTKHDFNNQYLAGDTMNDCLDLYSMSEGTHDIGYFQRECSFQEFLNSDPTNCRRSFFLLITSNVETLKKVQFHISYKEESGQQYEMDSPEIFVKP